MYLDKQRYIRLFGPLYLPGDGLRRSFPSFIISGPSDELLGRARYHECAFISFPFLHERFWIASPALSGAHYTGPDERLRQWPVYLVLAYHSCTSLNFRSLMNGLGKGPYNFFSRVIFQVFLQTRELINSMNCWWFAFVN